MGTASTEDPRAVLGRAGEDLAAAHLVGQGYEVLERNWRCPRGELDLVARDRDGTLVFCEVKTRSTGRFGAPSEAVGSVKRQRLRVLALRWVCDRRPAPADIRFDVISIVAAPGRPPVLEHLLGVL